MCLNSGLLCLVKIVSKNISEKVNKVPVLGTILEKYLLFHTKFMLDKKTDNLIYVNMVK